MRQEEKSRGQLRACLADEGWTVAEPKDLGEDFLVSIYHEGRATGVTFPIQLKSITDLHERKRKDYLPYDFKAAHLLHWESLAHTVVLMVWDVCLNEGRWFLADEAIADLDSTLPNWRTQKTVRVHLPLQNTTAADGLSSLRISIGRRELPMIAKGRDLHVQLLLAFGNDPESIQAREAFEHFYKEGEQAVLPGRVIRKATFPDWWQPFADKWDADRVVLTSGPAPFSERLSVAVDITTPSGLNASLSNVGLRVTRGGVEALYFSNEDQNLPMRIDLRVHYPTREITANLTYRSGHHGYNVAETRRLIEFCTAMSIGGKLTFTFLKVPHIPLHFTALPAPQWSVSPLFVDLVGKLCHIQEKMGIRLRIPEAGISAGDAESIHKLLEIIDTGKTTVRHGTATIKMTVADPQGLLNVLKPPQKDLILTEEYDGSYEELFGAHIETGPLTRRMEGELSMSFADLSEAISCLAPGDELSLEIRQVEVTEVFDHWRTAGVCAGAS
jgi:hypothetical protein